MSVYDNAWRVHAVPIGDGERCTAEIRDSKGRVRFRTSGVFATAQAARVEVRRLASRFRRGMVIVDPLVEHEEKTT